MRRSAPVITTLFSLLLVAASCSSSGPATGSTSTPGHGAISIAIVPNPIVATPLGGDRYDFPFEVVVRESGGRPVTVQRVSAHVTALGGIPVADESYDAAKINSMGYATTVAANGELHYKFRQQHSVPDERLFGGVSAEITVDATDDTGTPTQARTRVTVTR